MKFVGLQDLTPLTPNVSFGGNDQDTVGEGITDCNTDIVSNLLNSFFEAPGLLY